MNLFSLFNWFFFYKDNILFSGQHKNKDSLVDTTVPVIVLSRKRYTRDVRFTSHLSDILSFANCLFELIHKFTTQHVTSSKFDWFSLIILRF